MTQLLSPRAAAVVVAMALWWGWPVYDSVAQVDGAADDAILTVGRCIGSEATLGPLEETLIKEDIIEKGLLQTEVTNVMCKDMLEPAPDGTPLEKLNAAQNYIQEIKLIKGAMGEATNEAATRGTDAKAPDHHNLAGKPLDLPRWTVLGATEEGSTDGGGIGELNVEPSAYLQDVVQGQYDDGGGGGTASATASAGGGGGVAAPGGSDGTGGDEIGGLEPSERQAAAAANAGEADDAPISERLRQKEDAAKDAGASPLEAQAAARCGVEVDFFDAGLKRIEDLGLFEVTPDIPEEMRLRATEKAGLQVKPATKKEFQEINRKHEAIDGASESAAGCIILTDRMRATLQPLTDLETLKIIGGQGDDIEELSDHRDTSWSWEIKGHQAGSPQLYLKLEYEISQEDQDFRRAPGSPVYEKQIKVTSSPAPEPPSAPEPPWWRRIFERISKFFGA